EPRLPLDALLGRRAQRRRACDLGGVVQGDVRSRAGAQEARAGLRGYLRGLDDRQPLHHLLRTYAMTGKLGCNCFGRRTLLKAASAFAGSTLLGGLSFKAFAQATNLAAPDRCFVFVYFSGGWDQLLAFDPRDPAV